METTDITVLEEENKLKETPDFTPAAVASIKSALKNPLGIISSVLVLILSFAFMIFEVQTGLLLTGLSLFLVIAEITVFIKAKNGSDGFALPFLYIAAFAETAVCAAGAVLYFLEVQIPFSNIVAKLTPDSLSDLVGTGFQNAGDYLCAFAVLFCCIAVWAAITNCASRHNTPKSGLALQFSVVAASFTGIMLTMTIFRALGLFGLGPVVINKGSLPQCIIMFIPSAFATVAGILVVIRFVKFYFQIKKVKYAFCK